MYNFFYNLINFSYFIDEEMVFKDLCYDKSYHSFKINNKILVKYFKKNDEKFLKFMH
jgi:hypothetical protein